MELKPPPVSVVVFVFVVFALVVVGGGEKEEEKEAKSQKKKKKKKRKVKKRRRKKENLQLTERRDVLDPLARPKVRQLHDAPRAHEAVGPLDVPVRDPVRVQVRQARQDLPRVGRRDPLGQRAEPRDEARDRAAGHVLEEDVELRAEVVVLVGVVFLLFAAAALLHFVLFALYRGLLASSRGASGGGAAGRVAPAAVVALFVVVVVVVALFPSAAPAAAPVPAAAGAPLRQRRPLLRAQVPHDVRVVEPGQQLHLRPQGLDVRGEPPVVPLAGRRGGRGRGREVCKVVVVKVVAVGVGVVFVVVVPPSLTSTSPSSSFLTATITTTTTPTSKGDGGGQRDGLHREELPRLVVEAEVDPAEGARADELAAGPRGRGPAVRRRGSRPLMLLLAPRPVVWRGGTEGGAVFVVVAAAAPGDGGRRGCCALVASPAPSASGRADASLFYFFGSSSEGLEAELSERERERNRERKKKKKKERQKTTSHGERRCPPRIVASLASVNSPSYSLPRSRRHSASRSSPRHHRRASMAVR